MYNSSQGISKAYVTFSNSITLKCEPYCSDINPLNVLKKIVKIGPQNSIFNQYRSWPKYLQSRSLEINTDGTITFSSDMILTPYPVSALVDLSFTESQTYQSKDKTYTTSGTITGLVSVGWSDIVQLSSTCQQSKLLAAQSAFSSIKRLYSNYTSWSGNKLTLTPNQNCPANADNPFTPLCSDPYGDEGDNNEDSDEIKPSSVSVTTSRTEGTINFTFEWSTTQNQSGECVINGVKTETTIEITERQPNFVEHYIPSYGTLLQNMRCNTAKRLSITNSVTAPENSCGQNLDCQANEGYTIDPTPYFGDDRWLIIGHTTTKTNNSYTVKQDYIECRT
jgi:hypothetical protein